jgi:RimJ/RimL family protein N-acetyltransferase
VSTFIEGERCYLRTLERADVEGRWWQWFNDPEVSAYMFRGVFPSTRESTAAFYESIVTSETDVVLAIMARDGDVHVGNVGLHRIDWVNRVAEFGIVIGEKEHWGRGIGQEATELIVRHGFDRLNLNRIWLGVLAEHEGARKVYERVGFRVEGTLRAELLRDGRAHDKLVMGLLAEEFRASP